MALSSGLVMRAERWQKGVIGTMKWQLRESKLDWERLRRRGNNLNFVIMSVSLHWSDMQEKLYLITVTRCIMRSHPIFFFLQYCYFIHPVYWAECLSSIWPWCCRLKCFHMLFFGRCHSPSSENRHSTILSLWPIQRDLIICCRALWKRHQPPNWTCVVQTQIKHLGLSISPWVLSAY